MPDVFKAITNFNTGEISPRMMGRIDIDKYANACETLENWVIMPQGGIKTRPGMKSIEASGGGTSNRSRLIPIEISATENYMAELIGNGTMRFWKNGKVIRVAPERITNGNFSGVPDLTGWSVTTAGGGRCDGYLQYVGSNPCLEMFGITEALVVNVVDVGQTISLLANQQVRISMNVLQYWPTGNPQQSGNRLDIELTGPGGSFAQIFSFRESDLFSGKRIEILWTPPTTGDWLFRLRFYTERDLLGRRIIHKIDIDDVSVQLVNAPVVTVYGTQVTDQIINEVQYAQLNESLYLSHKSFLPKRLFRYSDEDWTLTNIKLSPPPTKVYERPITGTATIVTNVTPNVLSLSPTGFNFIQGSGWGATNFQVGWGVKYRDGYAIITSVINATQAQISIVYPFNTTSLVTGNWYLIGAPRCGITASKWMSTGTNRPIPVTGDMAQLQLAQAVWRQGDIGKYVKFLGGVYKITGLYNNAAGSPGTLQTADTGWEWAQAICLRRFTSGTTISGGVEYQTAQQAGGSWEIHTDHWYSGNYPSAVTTYEDRLVFGGTISHPATIWASGTGDYLNFGTGANAADPLEFSVISQPAGQIRWLASSRVLIGGTSNGEIRMSGGNDTPLTPTTVQTRAETGFGTASMIPHKQGQVLLFWQRSRKKLMALKFSFESDSYNADDLTILADHIAGGGIYDMDFQREFIPMLWNVKADGTLASLTFLPDQKVYGWARHVTAGVIESVCCVPSANEDRDDVYFVVVRGNGRFVERFEEGLNLDGYVDGLTGGTYTYPQFANLTVSCLCTNGTITTQTGTSLGQITLPTVAGHTWSVGIGFTATCKPVRPEVPIQAGVSQGRIKKWSEVYVRVIDTAGLKVNDEQLPIDEYVTGDVRVDDIGLSQEGYLEIIHSGVKQATVLMAHGTLYIGD